MLVDQSLRSPLCIPDTGMYNLSLFPRPPSTAPAPAEQPAATAADKYEMVIHSRSVVGDGGEETPPLHQLIELHFFIH